MKQNIGLDAMKVTLSRVVTLSVSLLTAMLLSRYLSLQEYGTYSQLILILELVTTVFIIGLPSSINYFAAKEEGVDYRQKFFSVYYSISTLLSLSAGVFLILFFPIIVNYFKNPLLNDLLYIIALLPWARSSISSTTNLLIVYKKSNWLFIYQLLHSIFIASIIIALKVFDLSFQHYMVMYLVIECIFSLVVYAIVKALAGKLFFNINKILIEEILKYSIPIGLSTVVATISIQLDKMIISRFYSVEELAIYANASREIPITFIAGSITAVLLPNIVKKLSNGETKKAIALWEDASVLSYLIICHSVTVLFMFAPEVISILYSNKFLPGVSVFRVYNIVLLLRFTYFGMILNAAGKTKFIMYSSIGSLSLNVLLNFAFYKMFGFIGPAIATLVSMIIIILIQLIVTSKIVNIPFNQIMPWRILVKISMINLCVGSLVYLSLGKVRLEHNHLKSTIIVIVWSFFYLILTRKELLNRWRSLNTE